jgi:hypothetical protein
LEVWTGTPALKSGVNSRLNSGYEHVLNNVVLRSISS